MTNFAEGSIWRKWDLHVHSPASILANRFSFGNTERGWNEYLSRLAEIDIAALGITDYFTIEGYKKVRSAWKAGKLPKIDLILPNIEFRLDEILYRDGDGKAPRRLNLHVIFSNKLDPSEIEDHFLHNLYFESRGNVDGKPFKERLKLSNLEELGRRLKAQLPNEHKDKSNIIVGAENATVSLEDIKNELTDSGRFVDKYVVVLDEANTSLIKWGKQDTQTRLTLLQNSHMVFSSNPNTRSWCLGLPPWNYGREQFIDTFDSLKPCIKGSDAHEAFFIGHPCGRREKHDCRSDSENCEIRYCWIKADTTFDGLKQVLYEPSDRVRIQELDPTGSRYNHTLSKVTVERTVINRALTIADTTIPINRGLVAVTGGRGTGKTALVDLIANCYVDPVRRQTSGSFVKRLGVDSAELHVSIEFTGADSFSKTIQDNEPAIRKADISYISQGQLDDYINDHNELTKRIDELLFGEATELLQYEYRALCSESKQLVDEISENSSHIINLEQQTSPVKTREAHDQKDRLVAELKDIARQLDEISDSSANDSGVKTALDAQTRLSGLREQQKTFESLKSLLIDAKSFLNEDIPRFNDVIDSINESLDTIDSEGSRFPRIEYNDKEKLDGLAVLVDASIKSTLSDIDKLQDELKRDDEKVAQHTGLLDQQSEMEAELEKVEENLRSLGELEAKLISVREKRAGYYKEMLTASQGMRNKYFDVIESFEQSLDISPESDEESPRGVLQDLEFLAEIRFDRGDFLQQAEDLLDNRSINVAAHFNDTLQAFESFCLEDGAESIDLLAGQIEKHVNDPFLREKIKPNKSINLDDFFKVFYRDYFNVIPTVLYKNTRLNRLSLGQKATVLFKIYLAHGEYPVIIDSHDDYLDNEFIMQELVPAIKEAKLRRQVILVSNNANVVVNSDSEQVVIANYLDGTISYSSGSLENPDTREKLVQVLEGGEEAFEQRQKKYRMV